jgi:hypothetical protein
VCRWIAELREDERKNAVGTRVPEVKTYADGYFDGQGNMLSRCIEAVQRVAGYSVPAGMSLEMFIDAMRHEYVAVLRDLWDQS